MKGGIVPQIARNLPRFPTFSMCLPNRPLQAPASLSHQSPAEKMGEGGPPTIARAQMKLDMKSEMGSGKPSTRGGRHSPAAPLPISQRRPLGAAQAFLGGSNPRSGARAGPVFLIARA